MALVFFSLLAILSLYVIVITAYLLVLSIGACFFIKKANHRGKPFGIAVVIPAHNEEEHIEATVAQIRKSNYPAQNYTVFVIADNCDDGTAERARQAGARVVVRTDPVRRGKGQALDWFLRKHRKVLAAFDGIAMIDADTRMDVNFLKEVSASLRHPRVKVVQGYYGVSNAAAHWRSGLLSAAFHVFNHLRPAGHNSLGGTAGLRGNGMAFRTAVLLDTGWPAHSIVEDYEYSLDLLLRGTIVHYNPDAIVTSDMPTQRRIAESQRMRWEGMGFGMKKRFIAQVFRRFVRTRKVCYLDTLIDFFVPPLALLVVGQVVVLAAAAIAGSGLTLPLALCLPATLFYVVSGLVLRGATWAEWRSLLKSPVYIVWKMCVYYKMRNFDSTVWKRTKRPSEYGNNVSAG